MGSIRRGTIRRMPTVTAIRPLRRRQDRVAVHLDGVYWSSAPAGAVVAEGLAVGLELSAERAERLALAFERGRAVHYAVDLLSRRDCTTAEVRSRMAAKLFPEPAIDAAVTRLAALGYLDDERYARRRVTAAAGVGMSRGKVTERLRRAGVGDETVKALLEECYPRAAEFGAARAAAARLDPVEVATREGRARAGRFLLRRAFPNDVVKAVLDEIARQAPTAGAVEGETAVPTAVDVAALAALVGRRYAGLADDQGVRRRAWAFLARRRVPPGDIGAILARAADG
jgi:regulatory protein